MYIRTQRALAVGVSEGKRANKARKLVKEFMKDGGENDDKNNSSNVTTK